MGSNSRNINNLDKVIKIWLDSTWPSPYKTIVWGDLDRGIITLQVVKFFVSEVLGIVN